jgi:hypothetical protein
MEFNNYFSSLAVDDGERGGGGGSGGGGGGGRRCRSLSHLSYRRTIGVLVKLNHYYYVVIIVN